MTSCFQDNLWNEAVFREKMFLSFAWGIVVWWRFTSKSVWVRILLSLSARHTHFHNFWVLLFTCICRFCISSRTFFCLKFVKGFLNNLFFVWYFHFIVNIIAIFIISLIISVYIVYQFTYVISFPASRFFIHSGLLWFAVVTCSRCWLPEEIATQPQLLFR